METFVFGICWNFLEFFGIFWIFLIFLISLKILEFVGIFEFWNFGIFVKPASKSSEN
jgi:hypothetical protein